MTDEVLCLAWDRPNGSDNYGVGSNLSSCEAGLVQVAVYRGHTSGTSGTFYTEGIWPVGQAPGRFSSTGITFWTPR